MENFVDYCKIMEDDLIEKYLLGELSPDEEEIIEKHCFGCNQCFQRLREIEAIILALKEEAKRGKLTFEEPLTLNPPFHLLERVRSYITSPVFAAAMAILVIVLIYPAWRGMVSMSKLETTLKELRQPQVNVQSYSLQQTRAGEKVQIVQIPVMGRQPFLLHFNILEETIPNPRYAGEILNQQGKVIWRGENLKGLGEYEIFTISGNTQFFEEGVYTLRVYEINPEDNNVVDEFEFFFKMAK